MRVRRSVTALAAALGSAAFFVIAAQPAHATGTTYWISPTGSDSAAGTSGAPFQTIQHCATIAVAGDICQIMTGTYRESVIPANSGTAGNPITFTKAPGATVTIDGSDPLSGWTLDSGHIYKASVTLSSSLMGWQLFQGSTSIPSARYPSTGTDLLHMNRATAATGTTHNPTTDVSTIKDASLPSGLAGATAVFWGGYQWLAQTAVIATSSAGQLTFTGGSAQCAAAPYDALCTKPGTRYYVTNSKSLMTYAGSWYYDSTAHVMYYWSPTGTTPSGVTVKQRDYAFDLSSRSYITVSGISLFGATITTDSHTMLDSANPGLPADCNQIPDPSYGGTHNLIDSITATYVSQFDKTGECNTHLDIAARLHLYNTGIVLNGSYNTLQNSTIAWSAGNGVGVLGDHNTVTNNLIHDTDYMGTYSSGVYMQGRNHTIIHNTMYNSGQSGLVGSYFGDGIPTSGLPRDFTNNMISYNNVYNFGLLDQDGGGMYFCCTESASGGSIDHNWVHDGLQPGVLGIGGAVYNAEAGIYLDAGSQDFTVHHNVAFNDGGRAMAINGNLDPGPQSTAQNLMVYNNTFAATPVSFNAGSYYRPNLTGSLLKNNIYTGSVQLNGVNDPTQSNNLSSAATTNFVSATAGDLRITTSSAAVNAGTVIPRITDGYVGSAPDEGAYESGGDQWVPGCNFTGCMVSNDTAHSVDDVSSTVSPTGAWSRSTNALAYSGTDTFSQTAGATQTITFTGTQAQVYGLLSNVGGYGDLSVDGGPVSRVDFFMYNGMGDALIWTTPVLAYGSHTITLVSTGAHSEQATYAYVALDRIAYTTTGSTSYIDDATSGVADNSISYVGTGWFHCTVNCNATYGQTFYNGTATGDNIAGEKMYVFFTGTQVSLTGFVGTNGETTPTVSIDGGPNVPISFYSTMAGLTSVYLSPILPWGHHSLRMNVGGPSTAWASFDDLVVTP